MNEIIKVCKHHGELSAKEVIKSGKPKGIQTYKCLICKKETYKKNYIKNKDKILLKHKISRETYPEKHKEQRNRSARKMRSLNKDKFRKRQKEYYKRNSSVKLARDKRYRDKIVREVTDTYAKHQLTCRSNLRAQDIPQSLVELKKVMIKLKRKLKE